MHPHSCYGNYVELCRFIFIGPPCIAPGPDRSEVEVGMRGPVPIPRWRAKRNVNEEEDWGGGGGGGRELGLETCHILILYVSILTKYRYEHYVHVQLYYVYFKLGGGGGENSCILFFARQIFAVFYSGIGNGYMHGMGGGGEHSAPPPRLLRLCV